MVAPPALPPEALYRRCDPGDLGFMFTSELGDLVAGIGQTRALDAARFSIEMPHGGYNLFVMGDSGSGKRTLLRELLEQHVATDGHVPPRDWCYVHNFADPGRPRSLTLPAGLGIRLQTDMAQLVAELQARIPAVFESDEYRNRRTEIDDDYNERQSTAFGEIGEDAARHGIALLRTPNGFSFAPAKGDEAMTPDDYAQLSDEEKERLQHDIVELQERIEAVIRLSRQWRKQHADRVRELNEEVVLFAVGHLIEGLRKDYAEQPDVCTYLDEVQHDVIENMDDFRRPQEKPSGIAALVSDGPNFMRYAVNLLVGHAASDRAPVVMETHPTLPNLLGRIEHLARFGALVTSFTLIKPGALHRANGGYLLLDAYKLLTQPFAWDALKRALTTGELRIESLGETLGLASTVSLEPQPIPLEIKIVLLGDRMLYFLLDRHDPEFGKLFKVAADFEDDVERNADNQRRYARVIATIARREGLRPFTCEAVARLVEQASRRAEDADRLSTHMDSLADLLRQADNCARHRQHANVAREDVDAAVASQRERTDRLRVRAREAIVRKLLHIDTSGMVTGQINGLSVAPLGDFTFSHPTRITANTRLGDGELVDIQREVKLGGAVHSKGVLILASFIASRFAAEQPLSLSASLVFEQTYGHVDGDSASLAELCALLSSLAGAPIRQSLAVTGSVDQFGRVQAIGGVNHKIEGFFDICRERGLDGRHGVLIPDDNRSHLMLRADIVDAAREGRFHVTPVAHVDEAIELLTGISAGTADSAGHFPPGSINRLVADRLAHFYELRCRFDRQLGKRGAEDDEQSHA